MNAEYIITELEIEIDYNLKNVSQEIKIEVINRLIEYLNSLKTE